MKYKKERTEVCNRSVLCKRSDESAINLICNQCTGTVINSVKSVTV